jgi:hypothetical protein
MVSPQLRFGSDGCGAWRRRGKMGGGKSENQVYKDIEQFDPGLADRWWSFTEKAGRPGDKTVEITVAGMREIVGDLGSKVTPELAGAIDQLLRWTSLTQEAYDGLKRKIVRAHDTGALWRGTSRRLNGPTSGALRADIKDAFRLIGNIDFTSPMSSFHYISAHYTAVLELIKRAEIYLYEVEDHGLTRRVEGPAAYYDTTSDPRMLVLNQARYGGGGTERSMIHECTHAIQDWMKVPGLIGKHAEADAHVCGWVVGRLLGEKTIPGLDEEIHVTAFDLADFVIKKTTLSDRQKFTDTYKQLVGFVEIHPSYAQSANQAFAQPDPENTDQKQVFADLLAKKP